MTSDRGIFVPLSRPAVTSDVYPPFDYAGGVGVAGEFTFTPGMPNVVEYVYQFDTEPELVVAADADGRARITYTPSTPDLHFLSVYSRTADGIASQDGTYPFLVNPGR